MNEATRTRLLEINRDFYATVAAPFDATRQAHTPGKARLVALIGAQPEGEPLRVLDVGCGNGRLAFMLEALGRPIDYVGVDAAAGLLELAAENTRDLIHVQTRFIQADLAGDSWPEALVGNFDAVLCLATLQHLPGYALRSRLVKTLGGLTADDGVLIISAWQFMESERLRARVLPWEEAGVDATQIEPGDALLPWKQEVYAVRYVHQTTEQEFTRLATDAGLRMVDTFRADGREGNLNLYVLLQRTGKGADGDA
jgi:SAM-dependent methyltransferase